MVGNAAATHSASSDKRLIVDGCAFEAPVFLTHQDWLPEQQANAYSAGKLINDISLNRMLPKSVSTGASSRSRKGDDKIIEEKIFNDPRSALIDSAILVRPGESKEVDWPWQLYLHEC